MPDLHALIRAVPDFPTAGVVFRDITPLLADPPGFARCLDRLAEPWQGYAVHAVCAVEARGFIFGAALAERLGAGFVPLRKPGKLPPPVVTLAYELEYARDHLEIRADALSAGQRVILVDDVLATGGTLVATRALVGQLGARVLGASVVIELADLGGRERWGAEQPLHALVNC
ncbi:MAG: adenine phosphoribosyltransferase [Xanthomonadales bacterium]|nr:adenine phosphoribosyltransferase [Xanthomonadales bacterium]